MGQVQIEGLMGFRSIDLSSGSGFLLLSHDYSLLGELYVNAGQKERALENLKKAEAMLQEMGIDYWLARTKKLLEMI